MMSEGDEGSYDQSDQFYDQSYSGVEAHEKVAVTTIAQLPEQLLISACGRTCSIDMHHSQSIVELQAALQRSLQMEGQAFHICDINGALLSTDMQVQDAIASGLTPLCATLPDKSLHHLENRREELAQMQWKLVRDQMTQGSNQYGQVNRQITEIQYQMQALQRESSNELQALRSEFAKAASEQTDAFKVEHLAMSEACNGAVLLINGERSKRELSVQGFEKHIHGVCDMLDGERAARRQDMAAHMSEIQELKAHMDVERSARAELQESMMDLKKNSQKVQEDLMSTIRDQADRISKLQLFADTISSDTMSRFAELEERTVGFENNLSEHAAWTTQNLDKLGERCERVQQASETLRFTSKHHEGSIASALERVNELENFVRQYHAETSDSLLREKQARDDQVRRTSQMVTSESLKQITDVEKRLTVRLERESAEREKNFTSMIDEVSKIVEDRKLFRDQTITKTVNVPTPASDPGAPMFRSSQMAGDEPDEPDEARSQQQNSFQPGASDVTIHEGMQEKYRSAGATGSGYLALQPSFQPSLSYGGYVASGNTPMSNRSSTTPQRTRLLATASLPGGSLTMALSPGTSPMQVISAPGSNGGSIRAPLSARAGPARVAGPIGSQVRAGSPMMAGSPMVAGSPMMAGSLTISPRMSQQIMQKS